MTHTDLQGHLPDHLLAIADTMVDQGHHTKAALVVAGADAITALLASLTAKDAEIAALRAALTTASNALESLDAGTMRTYKARNGREVGIQADDGEACDIIHSDITHECLIALEVARTALHENPESKA